MSRIVVVVGLPASGKSTWLAKRGLPVLSSDHVRELLADDATIQTIHKSVFSTLRNLLRMRIRLGRPVTYVDATNLTPKERKPYIAIGRKFGCPVEALFLDVPVETCLRQNEGRQRKVPPEVIQSMAARLVKPDRREGFERVEVVREPLAVSP